MSWFTLVHRLKIITKAPRRVECDGSCTGFIHDKGRCNLQEVCSCLLCVEDFGSMLHSLLAMYRSESLLVPINNGMLSGDTIEMGKALRTKYSRADDPERRSKSCWARLCSQ